MSEFLLIFRADSSAPAPTPEQLKNVSKPWQDWIGGMAANGTLANPGFRIASDGKIVKPGQVITNGPYVELKEVVGGCSIINAESLAEASEIAKGCPILNVGGSVEVRPVIPMDM